MSHKYRHKFQKSILTSNCPGSHAHKHGGSQNFCRGGKQPAVGLGGAASPQWGPGADPLEADKISAYSFNCEVLEIQINNTPMTLPSHRRN